MPAVVKFEICRSSSCGTVLPSGVIVSRSSPSLTIRISCVIASFPTGVAATIGSPVVASQASPAAAAVAVAGSQVAPPSSKTSLVNTGWWLGVSPAGVTGTTKRAVVPLAPGARARPQRRVRVEADRPVGAHDAEHQRQLVRAQRRRVGRR